jgi:hypothetical protein
VTLSDSAAPTPRTASQAFTLTTRAAPALSITTSSALPDGMAGTGRWYVAQLTAAGGTAPYTWAVASGTLPADLTLSPEGRLYSTLLDEGSSTFAVQVTDSTVGTPLTDTATLTLTVKPPITAPLLDSLGANMMNRLLV